MLHRKLHLLSLTALSAVVCLAVSCSPTGSDSVQIEMSDLVGLWDSSVSRGALKDVMYTRITSNGDIIEYDFDGDEADRGLNCYLIDSGSVKSIEKNRFMVTAEMHANRQYEVELEMLDDGHALKVYFLDTDDQDNDGDRDETVSSQIWTRISDESLLANEPSCRQRYSW
jgi:hypothetical protein